MQVFGSKRLNQIRSDDRHVANGDSKAARKGASNSDPLLYSALLQSDVNNAMWTHLDIALAISTGDCPSRTPLSIPTCLIATCRTIGFFCLASCTRGTVQLRPPPTYVAT